MHKLNALNLRRENKIQQTLRMRDPGMLFYWTSDYEPLKPHTVSGGENFHTPDSGAGVWLKSSLQFVRVLSCRSLVFRSTSGSAWVVARR